MRKAFLGIICLVGLSALFLSIKSYLHDKSEDPPDTSKWLIPFSPDYHVLKLYCRSHINSISEFQRLYPRCSVFISPSFQIRHSTVISAETLVYGKYEVRLSQDIKTDRATLTAVPIGSPLLTVIEISEWSPWFTRYGSMQIYGADWNKLRLANGDLSSIIDNPVKNQPLPNAEQYLKVSELKEHQQDEAYKDVPKD